MNLATADTGGILNGLDADQRKAAMCLEGPVAIVAGAGTGKTRTITHRIAYGVMNASWNPESILAVTFTAKAAAEMRQRLEMLGIVGVNVHTFHAAALRQMYKFWPEATSTMCPKLETNKAVHILDAAKRLGFNDFTKSHARIIGDEISWAKVSLVLPSEYETAAVNMDRETLANINAEMIASIYEEYDNIKGERGMIDFEDILLIMIHLITNYPEVARQIRQKYKHIIVDEFQDVSPLQYSMLDCWLGSSREICVVGDPSQTIYSFTGATPQYLLEFEKTYKPQFHEQNPPKRVELTKDYRSSAQIVKLANNILELRGAEGFEPLTLTSKAPNTNTPVKFDIYNDDAAEAKAIVKLIKHHFQKHNYNLSDMAILVRTNQQCTIFAEALKEAKIRCWVKNSSGVIPVTDDTKIETTPENAVTLASLHSSKGLEWPCVFLAGLSDGQVPINRARTDENIEEERRLLYVGVTRAKERLYMSMARYKQRPSQPNPKNQRMISRFLDSLWEIER